MSDLIERLSAMSKFILVSEHQATLHHALSELTRLYAQNDWDGAQIKGLHEREESLRARVKVLEDALRPFAKLREPHKEFRDTDAIAYGFTIGDLRAARAALNEGEKGMSPELELLLKQDKERYAQMTPFERALEAARQRRSYVVAELQWGSDADEAAGRDAMTKEAAQKLYDATDDGLLLAELEKQAIKP